MSENDYATIATALNCSLYAGTITERRYTSAIKALDRAIEIEFMYEGLCE